MMDWLADEQPMCSVLECRQSPGDLHPQRSKAQGDTVPSDPFLSRQAENIAAGDSLLIFKRVFLFSMLPFPL